MHGRCAGWVLATGKACYLKVRCNATANPVPLAAAAGAARRARYD